MKKIILLLMAAPLICHAQHFNPNTGTIDEDDMANLNSDHSVPSSSPETNLTGIPCNPGSFWAIDAIGNIMEYQLTGNMITFSDTVLSSTNNFSLAFANNLSGGNFSPTFFTSVDTNAAYYNGTNWSYMPGANGSFINNCGGSGNYLYFIAIVYGIIKSDGVNYSTIYMTGLNRYICIYDLAADQNGNVYFLTGHAPPYSDSLVIINPSGNIILQAPFILNIDNAYGSFIMNSIFYIGLGGNNPVFPNTLLPVTFSGNNAIAGTPVPFPGSGGYYDLESCNQGLPLSISSANNPGNAVYITTPVKDICTIESGKDEIKTISMYDVSGKEVKAIGVNNTSVQIDVSGFPNGLYVLSIRFSSSVINRKVEIRND